MSVPALNVQAPAIAVPNPAFLTRQELTDDEQRAIATLNARLEHYAVPNFEANAYYEGAQALKEPGFAIPEDVARKLAPVAGAPGTVVDVLDERLEFLGWDDAMSGNDELGLAEAYDENELDSEAPMGHVDALIYGLAWVRVGTDHDSDVPLITTHAPTATTGVRDPRTRRLRSVWSVVQVKDARAVRGVLDLPDESIPVVMGDDKRWHLDHDAGGRDEHGMGRVPVVALPNRTRSGRRQGRSEITKVIRGLTDDMMRAGLGMGTNSLFYSIPQLMLLGRGPEAFVDRHGNPLPGWRVLAGHALAIKKDAEGDVPKVHQVTVASPQPFIEQLREFRMQVAAEAGMPADYLGIQTANPTSADAIRAGEARLVRRAERRQSSFGRAWLEVARLVLLVRDGEIPTDFAQRVTPEWQSAATPTRAAAADEVTKLVSAGVLRPDSPVVRKRLLLSRSEARMLEAEQRRMAGRALVEQLAPEPDVMDASEAKARFDALGVAIRSGVEQDSAARLVGLEGVKFSGATPVSLRLPREDASELETRD